MNSRRISLLAACIPAILLMVAPSTATARKAKVAKEQAPSPAIQALIDQTPQKAAVQSYYGRWRGPAWFDDNGRSTAALIAILRRAPLDGLAAGPTLANRVEEAARLASSGNPADRIAAGRVLSAAWLAYVETIRQPVGNMIYGYPSLGPKPVEADQILSAASAAPSLEQHLAETSAVNPIYAELRQAAWQAMQASPGPGPDPRIVANLARLRSLPNAQRFALINVATQRMQMFENGQPVDSMKVIVGTKELPTPMISSVIYYTTFNPYWNVPDHLVRKTVAPNVIRQGQAYLKARGYQVMSDWTGDATVVPAGSIDWKAVAAGSVKIRVRQLPGPGNSMGKLKFSFANGQDIFLHDTPSKELFAKSERDLSNGCIRLEDARRFGRWLLGRDPVAPSAEPEQFVKLPQGVPVYVTYLTAQPVSGQITYASDIYGWDRIAGAQSAAASSASSDAVSAK